MILRKTPDSKTSKANLSILKRVDQRSEIRINLEAEATVESVVISGSTNTDALVALDNCNIGNSIEYHSRRAMNYDTLEMTDDEYLLNVSDDYSD